MAKLTNEQAYRALLMEFFDSVKDHPLLGMGSQTAQRRTELRHLIEACRPEDNTSAAGDVLYAKLCYDKPPC